MKKRTKCIYGISSCIAMLIIILDGRSAVSSIANGIDLCLRTVVPALFPFFVLSGIMNNCFFGQAFRFMEPVRKLCRIPAGTESILFIGLVSGYPVGAQLVTRAYASGSLSKENARRMLGFCSNAGPAFLFGLLSAAFSRPIISWFLWGVHIVSALIVGWLLPGGTTNKCILQQQEAITVTKALHNAIRNLAAVCGWVILFRLMLDFLSKWFLRFFPVEIQVLISGFIELSNGCILLQQAEKEGVRFILAAAMLAFGGMCVTMQTVSVAADLGIGYYFRGKLLQMLISVAVSCILQPFLFPNGAEFYISSIYLILSVLFTVLTVYLLRRKKVVAFDRKVLYNTGNECI